MDIEELLTEMLGWLRSKRGVIESASRIDGENAIGVEMIDGELLFIAIDLA